METFFCCTVNQKEEFKSVVQEHMLVYVVQGELDVLAGGVPARIIKEIECDV